MGRPKIIRPQIECPGCKKPFVPKDKHQEYCARGCASIIPPIERFWSKIDKRGPDECWLWLAAKHKYGHGAFRYRQADGKREQYAARFMWEITNGPIPYGRFTCHHCDNPPCVNPAHLYLGTMADNCRDRDTRQRHGSAMLSPEQVRRIRQLARTADYETISRIVGSNPTVVGGVVRGSSYQWVTEA